MHRNETSEIEMDEINPDNILKQSNNDWMKTSATENERNKLLSSLHQIENAHYKENKIKIGEMKQNVIRELSKVIDTKMKDRVTLNGKNT